MELRGQSRAQMEFGHEGETSVFANAVILSGGEPKRSRPWIRSTRAAVEGPGPGLQAMSAGRSTHFSLRPRPLRA